MPYKDFAYLKDKFCLISGKQGARIHVQKSEHACETQLKLSLEKSSSEKQILEEKLKILSQDSADIVLPGYFLSIKDFNSFVESTKTDSLIESLKNEIEDLKHELLSVQVTQARSLITAESSIKGSSSFAEELANCAEPGLKEKYETLEQTHEEVKKYLDKILTNVIERDPSLLMVNP